MSSIQAVIALLGTTGSAPFVGPLDGISISWWQICWINRLLSSWTGSLIRIRRGSDSAELDIGYLADGSLNVAALATFCSGTTGFVTKIYDQSGAANDIAQSNSSRQPIIYQTGTYQGQLVFDGSTASMFTANSSSGANSALTIFYGDLSLNILTGVVVIEELSANNNGNDAYIIYWNTGSPSTLRLSTHDNTPGGYSDVGLLSTSVPAANYTFRADRSQVTAFAQCVLYNEGVLATPVDNSSSGTLPNGLFGAFPYYIGARNDTSLQSAINFKGRMVSETAVSGVDIAAVNAALP